MKWRYGLLIVASSLPIASANATDRYALPPSKVFIESCQHQALRLHSGMIEKQRILHQDNAFWVRYDIQGDSGAEWQVLCDLTNGRIMGEQQLMGNGFIEHK